MAKRKRKRDKVKGREKKLILDFEKQVKTEEYDPNKDLEKICNGIYDELKNLSKNAKAGVNQKRFTLTNGILLGKPTVELFKDMDLDDVEDAIELKLGEGFCADVEEDGLTVLITWEL